MVLSSPPSDAPPLQTPGNKKSQKKSKIAAIKIVRKRIDDLISAAYNPRISVRDNKDFYKKLDSSIKEFDYSDPVVYNKRTGNVIGGNQRLEILRDHGFTHVDVVEKDLSLSREKALNLALNKINGDWDLPRLNAVLQELKDLPDFDVGLTGFDMKELEELEDQFMEGEEDDFDVDQAVQNAPRYKVITGDVFELGSHRLMCGDSTKIEDVERLMGGSKADMVFTDQPYGVDYASKNEFLNEKGKGNHIQTPYENDVPEDWDIFCKSFLSNLILGEYNTIYIWINGYQLTTLLKEAEAQRINLHIPLIWVKNNAVLSRLDYQPKTEICMYGWKGKHKFYGKNKTTVLEFNKPLSSKLHPTMKPLEMIASMIPDGSLQNQIVLDLFGGSGSTLIACEQTQRRCFMMEIDPIYCSVILERWEQYTGKKHKKLKEK